MVSGFFKDSMNSVGPEIASRGGKMRLSSIVPESGPPPMTFTRSTLKSQVSSLWETVRVCKAPASFWLYG